MLSPDQLAKLSEVSNPLVRQRFSVLYQLPQDLQESMFSEQTSGSIWQITKEKYNLPDSNISAVARIIGLIFLGELAIKNFIVELKNTLAVDIQKAQAIAQDINQAIFQPVRESLMVVHGISDANTRMHPNDANVQQEIPNYKQTPNTQIQNNQNFKAEPDQPQTNTDYEARQRRDGVLNKIRPPQPPVARPAGYIRPRNTVDLRRAKRKSRYNGFFT